MDNTSCRTAAATVAVLLAGGISTAGGQEDEATLRAYAAGYKAAFTCSATFNAGKSPEQIAAHELTGFYTGYREAFAALPDAVIDRGRKQVRVSFDKQLPPRIAQWRPHLGCVQLPVGAAATGKHLPALALQSPRRNDNAPWQRHAAINGSSGNPALDKVIRAQFRGPDFDPAFGRDALTSAVLIATPEAILAEHYIPGHTLRTSQRTWSVAKSIAATLIGAAVQQGIVALKQPAPIAAWQSPGDPRAAITIENLLQMASGLDSNRAGNRTDRLYFGGGRVEDTTTRGALEAPPGARWKYANNDTLLAIRALRAAMADDSAYLAFPFNSLFHRLGMLDTFAETDWGGDFVLSSQVWTSARDMARLGVLYLNDGRWNGERILPPGWAKYVATAAPAQPPAQRRQQVIPGYGAQFWLYNQRFPKIPDDAYAARGNRGQFLMIIPSQNLLIVRRGYDPAGGEGFQLHTFTAAVLQALRR